ncbi:AlbA family DNA-binding domain-containing protein ['Paenibacillus yunnanensis' Narsing Rao et al. 2020]|uniref:AlbA family DNA-binding domain-containing protein n=1 Tax=Paenibacillus tengchongensis TaxID=2608684 RepID=UPI00124C0283|nr:ATP-binding protein [Paenibacillus tengchongensis]
MRGIHLEEEIKALILSEREDDYWDFKQQHHNNKADLLHDIICMANNRVDRDAYIIFGIADKTFKVIGVENDNNRKNQQMIIDFLKSQKFVSGIRPRAEMRTLKLAGHEIDILIVKNSTDTPYFLTDRYSDGNRTVRANHIYTRVGDTNTDIDRSADINNIEYLWKKRFLLTRSPFEQIMKRLENKDEWKQDGDTYYNIYNPEFTITNEFEEDRREVRSEFYAYAMTNSSTMYQMLSVKYFGTQLYGRQVALLDSAQYSTPVPEWEFFTFGVYKSNPDYAMKYFTKDSPHYILNEFLYDEDSFEQSYARRRFFEVVLLFENMQEKDTFLEYIHHHKDDFLNQLEALDDNWSWIEANTQRQQEQVVIRLKTGKVLNQMLQEFREITR